MEGTGRRIWECGKADSYMHQRWGWWGSGELCLFGLWEQQSHQSSGQQQSRHQQHRYSTVGVHQLSKDDVGRDRRHSAYSGEEAESGRPEKKDELVQPDPPESMSQRFRKPYRSCVG